MHWSACQDALWRNDHTEHTADDMEPDETRPSDARRGAAMPWISANQLATITSNTSRPSSSPAPSEHSPRSTTSTSQAQRCGANRIDCSGQATPSSLHAGSQHSAQSGRNTPTAHGSRSPTSPGPTTPGPNSSDFGVGGTKSRPPMACAVSLSSEKSHSKGKMSFPGDRPSWKVLHARYMLKAS